MQKYLALRPHHDAALVVVNDAAWRRSRPADRKAVEDVLKARWRGPTARSSSRKNAGEQFKAAGATVLQPDVAEWRKATLAADAAKFEAKVGQRAPTNPSPA